MPNQPKTPARTVRVDDELWDAAKAEAKAKGENVSDVVRKALRQMLGTAPLVVAFALLLAWGSNAQEAEWERPLSLPAIAAHEREIVADIDTMIREQVTALGCDTRQRLTERVAVRNATGFDDPATKGAAFDTGVVRVVTLDEAWVLNHNAATIDDVWVAGWCG